MKYIAVTFGNNEVWRIPAQVVAEDRAKYFSDLDFQRGEVSDVDAAYQAELEYSLSDSEELIDYLRNNMDWEELRTHAQRLPTPELYDYAVAFDSARFDMVEAE